MRKSRLGCKLTALSPAALGLYGTLIASTVGVGAGGCGQPSAYQGPALRVSGDFNAWITSEQAPSLAWDGERYRGVVALPGDRLSLRLFSPATGVLVGRAATTAEPGTPAAPSRVAAVPGTLSGSVASTVEPFQISTPLPTRYVLEYAPLTGKLHLDLADDAEQGLSAEAAALVTALRGADQLSAADRASRAEALRGELLARGSEMPLQVGEGELRGLTFLHLAEVDLPDLSVVGDFNSWTAGRDAMQPVLDGSVAYLGRRASGVRLEYRFDLHGLRYPDPTNPEVAWDGAYLPPNPDNLLGGGVGEWNSVAFAPGYVETGSRMRQLKSPSVAPGAAQPEVFVCLPRGYAQSAEQRYPTVYIYDGKDALVRGRYDGTLQRLATAREIPSVIGVFIASPTTPHERLASFADFTDPQYPEISPLGSATANQLLNELVPQVEKTYRTAGPRTLLGIDIAGPYSVLLAWQDPQHRFTRIASQSGRFGWGDEKLINSPYIRALAADRSAVLTKLSFDYSDSDPPQAQAMVHDAVRAMLAQPGYAGKVQIFRQGTPAQFWDGLRSRLDASLIFLLHDLVKKP